MPSVAYHGAGQAGSGKKGTPTDPKKSLIFLFIILKFIIFFRFFFYSQCT